MEQRKTTRRKARRFTWEQVKEEADRAARRVMEEAKQMDEAAKYSVHVDLGENVHTNERKGNPEKGPAGSTIHTQEEVNEFVRKMTDETLYATPLGKTRGVKSWEKGEVFQAVNPPHWIGSPFFRSSDAERIYTMGYRKIVVVSPSGDGFDIELVMQ